MAIFVTDRTGALVRAVIANPENASIVGRVCLEMVPGVHAAALS